MGLSLLLNLGAGQPVETDVWIVMGNAKFILGVINVGGQIKKVNGSLSRLASVCHTGGNLESQRRFLWCR